MCIRLTTARRLFLLSYMLEKCQHLHIIISSMLITLRRHLNHILTLVLHHSLEHLIISQSPQFVNIFFLNWTNSLWKNESECGLLEVIKSAYVYQIEIEFSSQKKHFACILDLSVDFLTDKKYKTSEERKSNIHWNVIQIKLLTNVSIIYVHLYGEFDSPSSVWNRKSISWNQSDISAFSSTRIWIVYTQPFLRLNVNWYRFATRNSNAPHLAATQCLQFMW